ncbi:hypothetical protein ABZ769_26660 [Streptomyces olivoreticuli]
MRRHAIRPEADSFGETEMRDWYLPNDLLGIEGEQVIAEGSNCEETVRMVMASSGLTAE